MIRTFPKALLSDKTVGRLKRFDVVLPTQGIEGSMQAEVTVEFNVPREDITHMALVLYVKDGNDEFRVVAGADPVTLVPTDPVPISGNSIVRDMPLELTANATLPIVDPSNPKTEVRDTQFLLVDLGSSSDTVPPEPTGNFGLPPP